MPQPGRIANRVTGTRAGVLVTTLLLIWVGVVNASAPPAPGGSSAGAEGLQLMQQADTLGRNGRFDEAIEKAERALSVLERTLGPEHRDVGAAYNNLADLYHAKGDYAHAQTLYQRALAIVEKALGR